MSGARIAVCSWSLTPDDFPGLPALLAVVGVDAVQLALSPVALPGDPTIGVVVVDGLRRAGVRVVSGMMALAGEDYSTLDSIARTGGVRPDARWRENLEHAAGVADLAGAADIDLVTFHAGFIPEERGDPERATLLDRLRALADRFASRDVRLGLETGQETAETLIEALDDLDHPNVGVNFDPANMILYGKGDAIEALRLLAPRVCQVHVKDALPTDVPGTWGREVPTGEGAVDWPAFFEVAKGIDPPVDFVIEREAGEDRVADISAARELVARFVS